MSGNASFRLANTTVLSVCAVDAPVVMTSAAFDARLAATYRRVGTRPGMLERLAGVVERRWWPADMSFADAAAMAGAKALAEAGIKMEIIPGDGSRRLPNTGPAITTCISASGASTTGIRIPTRTPSPPIPTIRTTRPPRRLPGAMHETCPN